MSVFIDPAALEIEETLSMTPEVVGEATEAPELAMFNTLDNTED